ncbi:MAG: queuosine precursor transporter [Proteobacteria bacterium]|nr:queuosine precursor transporter [Pseudomonadota bacterium]
MTKNDSIYTSLCVLFSVLIVMGNLIYQKFVFLPILPFHTFELSVGAILYPLTFLLTDLITEFYGKEEANFCVRLGISMNILIACIIIMMDQLEATSWSKVDDTIFHTVFGLYSVAFIGSIIACYTAQLVDIALYLWIRKITKGKWLWARNNGSTAISLFIDTFIVISFMTAFHVLPSDRMWALIINSYCFKLFFSICSTPLFYVCVGMIKYLQKSGKTEPEKLASRAFS